MTSKDLRQCHRSSKNNTTDWWSVLGFFFPDKQTIHQRYTNWDVRTTQSLPIGNYTSIFLNHKCQKTTESLLQYKLSKINKQVKHKLNSQQRNPLNHRSSPNQNFINQIELQKSIFQLKQNQFQLRNNEPINLKSTKQNKKLITKSG